MPTHDHLAMDNTLPPETRDMHFAMLSMMEELEAIDFYNHRANTVSDPQLKAILEHNRDEEKEHTAMLLEWIRRQDPVFSDTLRLILLNENPITHR